MSRDRYPELLQFFGGYFHQDWDIEAATADGVLDIFNRTHSLDQRLRIADLIDTLTAEIHDDQLLEHTLFSELGCDYLPEADAMSVRSWLRYVSVRLREMN